MTKFIHTTRPQDRLRVHPQGKQMEMMSSKYGVSFWPLSNLQTVLFTVNLRRNIRSTSQVRIKVKSSFFVLGKSISSICAEFFLLPCLPRPVGPGWDKGKTERLREEVDITYRCNFFKWSSDWRKQVNQSNFKTSTLPRYGGQGQG